MQEVIGFFLLLARYTREDRVVISFDEVSWKGFKDPCFQRKTTSKKGSQIDCLIQTRFNTLFACKIKFLIAVEMKNKLLNFTQPKRFSCWPVLVHMNSIDENLQDSGCFSEIVDFSEFFIAD